MRRSVAAAPGRGTTHIGLANTLAAKGDHRGHREALQKAQTTLEAEKEHTVNPRQTYSQLASVYDALGETARAEQARQKAAAYRPNATGVDTSYLVGIAHPLAR